MNLEFYQNRRHSLLAKMPNNSIALLASGSEVIRNNDVEYPFRANSDFGYVTGFDEPDSYCLIKKTKEVVSSFIFVRPNDKEMEIWNGRRLGVERAAEVLGFDKAYSNEEFWSVVSEQIEGVESLVFSFGELNEWVSGVEHCIQSQKMKSRKGASAPKNLQDLDAILHEMRVIKTQEEISYMREAAQISVKGHLKAMQFCAQNRALNEMQLQAELESEFRCNLSPRVAFSSIVAGGQNACILHYTENHEALNQSDLVLIDAGAEVHGYSGDITTTFPVSGRFSPEQKAIYELVLSAQQAVIEMVQPGIPYDALHIKTLEVLINGLISLGLLSGSYSESLEQETYKAFFMHGTGHWLGRDVHDVGSYKLNGQWRSLEPGMVFTVEPGLYISPDNESVDSKWRGIGVRIEDDILVTESGYEVLTVGLPRTVNDIELFMNKSKSESHAAV
jgi:Xaa-Pro aminopeptidase